MRWQCFTLLFLACCAAPPSEYAAPTSPELRAELDFTRHDFAHTAFPAPQFQAADGTFVFEGSAAQSHSLFRHVYGGLPLCDGFGVTTGAWFPLSGALGNGPQIEGRTSEQNAELDSPFVLFDVDVGLRMPISVHASGDTRPFGPEHTLALMPEQGVPLAVGHLYAAWVNVSGVRSASAEAAVRAWDWADARAGVCGAQCPNYVEDLDRAWQALRAQQPNEPIFAFTAFRTGDPKQLLRQRIEAARAHAIATEVPWRLVVSQPEYCGYETIVSVPVFQRGTAPFNQDGGEVVADAGGLVVQRRENARVFLSVPRSTGDVGALPTAVVVRAGAGADRALFDRGVVRFLGGAQAERGIAVRLAEAGYAGISMDGPQGGMRNVTGEEQFNFFSISNERAMIGNLEQSAYELAMLPAWLSEQRSPMSECSAPTGRTFASELVLIGHSTGASIAPLAATFVPEYDGLVLSGAGGSFAANLVYKEQPLVTLPLVAGLLGVPTRGLSIGHPALQLFQWAAEHVDTQVFANELVRPRERPPRDVLVIQGIVDHYILPPIANAFQAPLAIDQAGDVLDASVDALAQYRSLSDFFGRSRRRVLAFPVLGNIETGRGNATAAVVQLAEDGVQDGHEVFWQRREAHALLRCFLRSRALGVARIETQCGL